MPPGAPPGKSALQAESVSYRVFGLEPSSERLERSSRIGGTEHARPRHEHVAAGVARLVDRVERDPAVDLEHDLGRQQLPQPREPARWRTGCSAARPSRG